MHTCKKTWQGKQGPIGLENSGNGRRKEHWIGRKWGGQHLSDVTSLHNFNFSCLRES